MVFRRRLFCDILIKATLILSLIQAGLAIYTGIAGLLDETTFSAILDLSFGVVFFIWSSPVLFIIWKELYVARIVTIVFAASYCILSLFYISFVFILINLLTDVSPENQSCRSTISKRQFKPILSNETHRADAHKQLGLCLAPVKYISNTIIIDIIRVSLQLTFMIVVAVWSVVYVRRMAKLQNEEKDFQFSSPSNRSSSKKQMVVVEGTQFVTVR
ncbi:hypothetical protein NEOLI_005188 [Neolecta irregularis DAH-3]|uniref:Uncharacterized protein n=1 Tax=Neolecta irregularis (strain DAH-3) TaxID=1198029 RepID=A0A1U7LL28_NEOID|nr:hypothetical protein NEOLI_005188 [Neolecta irregularis DAH-3]|eukprot:OLL23354.1 hypothetical protein NEOLI_005188 [Neolecta irregularis DAH-3]